MGRWIKFFIAIAIGAVGGLYFAWAINPVQLVETVPETLRQDYKTDYVLMVAEVYQAQRDPAQAARSLALLGDETPAVLARQAVVFAQDVGYSDVDVQLLADLLAGLQQWNPPAPGGSSP